MTLQKLNIPVPVVSHALPNVYHCESMGYSYRADPTVWCIVRDYPGYNLPILSTHIPVLLWSQNNLVVPHKASIVFLRCVHPIKYAHYLHSPINGSFFLLPSWQLSWQGKLQHFLINGNQTQIEDNKKDLKDSPIRPDSGTCFCYPSSFTASPRPWWNLWTQFIPKDFILNAALCTVCIMVYMV